MKQVINTVSLRVEIMQKRTRIGLDSIHIEVK